MNARYGIALLAVGALAACGEDQFPSRDWSGTYLARQVASSSDCTGAALPPPLTGFHLAVHQMPDNRVSVWLNPIITLQGSFAGDHLEAQAVFVEDVALPDSLRRRLSPADSFDAIAYDLDADFAEEGFRARYEIRTPDMHALVEGTDDRRCSYRYQLSATRFEAESLGGEPWLGDSVAPGAPASSQGEAVPGGAP